MRDLFSAALMHAARMAGRNSCWRCWSALRGRQQAIGSSSGSPAPAPSEAGQAQAEQGEGARLGDDLTIRSSRAP